ncbi:CbtB-domain containing protein [Chroococcidiopsis sp [FACHB-1243]]|uniref:CbtB-domain containing protein n=1 Tax=Chroococcidiopsis sp. [FACHB-1243] TaxID=2692781 RepID=UPI0032207E1A
MPAETFNALNSSARYVMTARSIASVRDQALRFTLSTPVQASLYVSLCALILWTVYFTTYPAVHDRVHSLRHHTLIISCH